MKTLKAEFLAGFAEGWSSFWAPFVALVRALRASWNRGIRAQGGEQHNHVLH